MLHEAVCPLHTGPGTIKSWVSVYRRPGWWKSGPGLFPGRSESALLWHCFPGVLSGMGSARAGAGSCLPTGRDLLLRPTPSAIGQPAPFCPAAPHPMPGESSHPFREAPFLQQQRQTQESVQGQGHYGLRAGSALRPGFSSDLPYTYLSRGFGHRTLPEPLQSRKGSE